MIPNNYRETLCLLRVSIIYPSYFQQQRSLLPHRSRKHVTGRRRLNIPALGIRLGAAIGAQGTDLSRVKESEGG